MPTGLWYAIPSRTLMQPWSCRGSAKGTLAKNCIEARRRKTQLLRICKDELEAIAEATLDRFCFCLSNIRLAQIDTNDATIEGFCDYEAAGSFTGGYIRTIELDVRFNMPAQSSVRRHPDGSCRREDN